MLSLTPLLQLYTDLQLDMELNKLNQLDKLLDPLAKIFTWMLSVLLPMLLSLWDQLDIVPLQPLLG